MLVLNAPDSYLQQLNDVTFDKQLPGKTTQYDWVHLFVSNKAELDNIFPAVLKHIHPDTVLWISFRKQTAKVKSDINRDKGWDALAAASYESVAAVSIDDEWSALRFRPASKVKDQVSRIKPSTSKAPKKPVDVAADVQNALAQNKIAAGYFYSLAPSHQRAYLEYIEEAKKAITRQSRIERTVLRLPDLVCKKEG
jgi:hypothetical protein